MNILIVDDDYVDRKHIKRTLLRNGTATEIYEAESVDQAIEMFRARDIDVVLLDYRMPQRDGIEMLLELRNEPRDKGVAIIMLSNSEDEELALSCVRAGALDFVLKSEISRSRLRRAILHAQTRFELEQQLYNSYLTAKKLAEHDSLTGLANRFRFEESLKMSVASNQRDQFKLAMLLFDIDHFKYINDTHGHDIGDLLLQQIVGRIQGCLRGNELFARLGGDEFALVLSNLNQVRHVSQVGQRILKSMGKPFLLADIEVKVSVSIGVAIHPNNATTSEELYKFADIALYRAKKQGRKQMVFFEDAMQKQFMMRYNVEALLQNALELNQFVLHFQPVFEPLQQQLTGFEALIRWQSGGEFLDPEEFIPVAEETGQILDIGRWVIRKAIAEFAQWTAQMPESVSLAINLSAVQLGDGQLVGIIKESLDKAELSPSRVEFELTETSFIEHSDKQTEVISAIHQMGCKLALDDFGTGFSSVSHLQNFPISTVKIDKSLMMAPKDKKVLALIRGLTMMLKSLDLSVVAEGIEDEESLQLCCDLEIEKVQGFHFSEALSADEITRQYLQPIKKIG